MHSEVQLTLKVLLETPTTHDRFTTGKLTGKRPNNPQALEPQPQV